MRRRAWFLVLLWSLWPLEAGGQGVGFKRTEYPVGQGPMAVAVADLNGDGKLDVGVTNKSDNSVSILLGNGDGTFGAKTDFATGGGPVGIVAGDFNGDGKLDLATANNADSKVSILLGNGDGTFGTKTDFATGTDPVGIAVGDFNGDGKLDLVTANAASNTVSILLGNGDGTLRPHVNYATGKEPNAVLSSDFNGDGKIDLATANGGADTISLLLGNGDGTFSPKTDFPTGDGPTGLARTDFNSDAKLDLVTAARWAARASVLLGKGDGTFNPKTDLGTDTEPIAVTAADFNADGKMDFLTANTGYYYYYYFNPSVSLRLGNGDGTFGSNFFRFSLAFVPSGMAAGDFNADGRIDVVVANWNENSVSVLLQSAALSISPCCSLDFRIQGVGSTSPAQEETLNSTGSFAATISSATLAGTNAGEFSIVADTCSGKSFASGTKCTISVVFAPTSLGDKTASVIITDSAADSPHTISLLGKSAPNEPIAGPLPASLSFGDFIVGGTSPAQQVSLQNIGGATMTISSASASGDFAILTVSSGRCGASLAPGAQCFFEVAFRPSAVGTRAGTLTITTNASSSPHTVALSGSGTDFSVSPDPTSPTSVTISPGGTASFKLNFSPASGFAGTVNLNCSTGSSEVSCSVLPVAFNMDGRTTMSATVNVSTTANALMPMMPKLPGRPVLGVRAELVLLALLLGATLFVARRRAMRRPALALGMLMLCALFGAACGGDGNVVKPPRTYQITVNASSSGVVRTITLSVVVR